jgi:hypothetical protein
MGFGSIVLTEKRINGLEQNLRSFLHKAAVSADLGGGISSKVTTPAHWFELTDIRSLEEWCGPGAAFSVRR